MKDYNYMSESCHCLPDCNSVKYSFSEKQIPIHLKKECDSSNFGFLKTIKKFKYRPKFYSLIRKASSLQNNLTIIDWKTEIKQHATSLYADCYELYTKDISLVEIELEGQTFMRMKQSLRVNWADKLGTVGGSLGLFCGFSVLAIFELVQWMFQLCCKCQKNENDMLFK